MAINYLKDYYKILEIAKEASLKEIKEAHHHLVLKYHPDKNKAEDAAIKFLEITEAYEILKDHELKQDYDGNHNDPGALMFIDVVTNNISMDKIKEYLDAGAFIDASNIDNKTILMYAANHGYVELSKFLIESGASLDAVDIYGNDPMTFAAAVQIDFSTDGFNIVKSQPKQQAYYEGESTEAKPMSAILEESVNINSVGIENKVDDLLERKAEIVQVFLEKGAKAIHKNYYGDNAMRHAISNHNVKIMELLDKAEKDYPNIHQSDGLMGLVIDQDDSHT